MRQATSFSFLYHAQLLSHLDLEQRPTLVLSLSCPCEAAWTLLRQLEAAVSIEALSMNRTGERTHLANVSGPPRLRRTQSLHRFQSPHCLVGWGLYSHPHFLG